MKQYLRRIVRKGMSKLVGCEDLPRLLDQLKRVTETFDTVHSHMLLSEVAATSQAVQRLLFHAQREWPPEKDALETLLDSGFRCFSQNDEDGILLHIFSLAGTTNKKIVEICAGDCIECNAANLIINHGWTGLLFDGNEQNIALGKKFYSRCRDTFFYPPSLAHAWITAENVNSLVAERRFTGNAERCFTGDIDLLSLDLDGMDFWVWKALTCIHPRVVVLEFNGRWGPHASVTLPYKSVYRLDMNRHPWCGGASLEAFVRLGRERGYRLVGIHRLGVNAFFVRSDVAVNSLPEVTSLECFQRSPILRTWNQDWLPPREERAEWYDVVEI
jgi:hypothetical protein